MSDWHHHDKHENTVTATTVDSFITPQSSLGLYISIELAATYVADEINHLQWKWTAQTEHMQWSWIRQMD